MGGEVPDALDRVEEGRTEIGVEEVPCRGLGLRDILGHAQRVAG